MRQLQTCAVALDGVERPARILEVNACGTLIEWHRGAGREMVASDRVRLVAADSPAWDHACEFDTFPADAFCGFCGFRESAHGCGAGPFVCTRFQPRAPEGPRLPLECPRCLQLVDELHGPDGARVCGSCRQLEREPQGETVRLFTPAPAAAPGQLMF